MTKSRSVIAWGFPRGMRKLLGMGSGCIHYLTVNFLSAFNSKITKFYTLNKYSLLYVKYISRKL